MRPRARPGCADAIRAPGARPPAAGPRGEGSPPSERSRGPPGGSAEEEAPRPEGEAGAALPPAQWAGTSAGTEARPPDEAEARPPDEAEARAACRRGSTSCVLQRDGRAGGEPVVMTVP